MTGEGLGEIILVVAVLLGLAVGLALMLVLWLFIPHGWWMLWTVLISTVAVPAGLFAWPHVADWWDAR